MTIIAGAITVDDGGDISGRGSGSTPGGFVVMRGSSIEVAGGVDVLGAPAGQITMVATGDIEVSGLVEARALARAESGGTIDMQGANITIAGELNAKAGTEDSLGGDIELSATGDVEISGLLTVVGPDGGTISLIAGAGVSSGNITLTATSELLADGAFQGGFGGSIDIDASGDGMTSGLVRMSGDMSVTGATAGDEVGGGSGGCLAVNATGGVIADNAAAVLVGQRRRAGWRRGRVRHRVRYRRGRRRRDPRRIDRGSRGWRRCLGDRRPRQHRGPRPDCGLRRRRRRGLADQYRWRSHDRCGGDDRHQRTRHRGRRVDLSGERVDAWRRTRNGGGQRRFARRRRWRRGPGRGDRGDRSRLGTADRLGECRWWSRRR